MKKTTSDEQSQRRSLSYLHAVSYQVKLIKLKIVRWSGEIRREIRWGIDLYPALLRLSAIPENQIMAFETI